MKHILFSILALVLIISGCAVLAVQRSSGDNFSEGTGQGFRGPITVQVGFSGGSISEIIILDSIEDRFVGGAAMEDLIDIVIENNTTDVDVISGATESSRGFLEAVQNAILNK